MLVNSNRVEHIDMKFDGDVSSAKHPNTLFIRLIAKEKRFTNVDFRYSIFDACYLRGCFFDSCDFTGCRFVNSNLNGSSFAGCKFDYAYFEKTFIDSDILDSGCPGHENLKMRFARSLRVNYQQLGDATSANKAISIELDATHVHLLKAWKSPESYYRKKYIGIKRIKVFFSWLDFRILDVIWGNGESASKLMRFTAILLVSLSANDVFLFGDPQRISSYIESMCKAPQIFLGISSQEGYAGWFLSTVTMIRLIIIAFFMSIILKRFNRR